MAGACAELVALRDLDRAAAAFGENNLGRVRPVRLEARAIHIRNPPLFVALGSFDIEVGGNKHGATLAAHLFEFGVCSLQLRIPIAPGTTPDLLAEFAGALDTATDPSVLLDNEIRVLADRTINAVERPAVTPLFEEYKVFRITRISGNSGGPIPASELFSEEQLVGMLVGERRRLSRTALRELIPHRFSYYEDDLTVLTWESALVIEPRVEDRDVEYVLEFANAQLLELRVYDLQLDAELPALYDRAEAARGRDRAEVAMELDLLAQARRQRDALRKTTTGARRRASSCATVGVADARRRRYRDGGTRGERAQGDERCVPRANLRRGTRALS